MRRQGDQRYALIIGLPILGGVLGHVIASSSRRRVIYIKP
jgi:hypothetical protein